MRLDPRVGHSVYMLAYNGLVPAAFVFCLTNVDAMAEWINLMGMNFATVPHQGDFPSAVILTFGLVVGWAAADTWASLRWIWRGR